MPTTWVRLVVFGASTSQTRLQYQRPRESGLKLPDLILPLSSRCIQRRNVSPRSFTLPPSSLTSWLVTGTQPSERFAPRLTRQRSFGFPAALRLELEHDVLHDLRWQSDFL